MAVMGKTINKTENCSSFHLILFFIDVFGNVATGKKTKNAEEYTKRHYDQYGTDAGWVGK